MIASNILNPNRMFVPLEPIELEVLKSDEDFQELYIDLLSQIQDLLCRRVENQGRPQFPEPEQLFGLLDNVTARAKRAAVADGRVASIVDHMNVNKGRAQVLFADSSGGAAYPADYVAKEIGLFLESVAAEFLRITQN